MKKLPSSKLVDGGGPEWAGQFFRALTVERQPSNEGMTI